MRSLFIKSVLLSLLCMSMFACSKDISVLKEDGTTSQSVNAVNIQDAIKIAQSFANTSNELISTRSSEIVVDNAFSIKGNSGNPLLHVINFKNGGFVLVAGDNRLKPVQAYSTEGLFTDRKNQYPLGLTIWIEGIRDSLNNIILNNSSQDNETRAAWFKLSDITNTAITTKSQDPSGGMLPEADTLVGPFITDSWHQKAPYNDYLDVCAHYYQNNNYAGDFKPVIGCVPLAIARVMRYHQYPGIFSWDSMPNSTASAITKTYIKSIHETVRSYAQSNNYGFIYSYFGDPQNPLGTGVSSNFPVGSFLCSEYGYASGMDTPYSTSSYTAMRRDLISYSLPCIIIGQSLYGDSHAWICDGYHYNLEYWYDYNNEPIGIINTYLHYCWGDEDPSFDGWFSPNSVSYQGASYSFNMKLVYHISPIDYWNEL